MARSKNYNLSIIRLQSEQKTARHPFEVAHLGCLNEMFQYSTVKPSHSWRIIGIIDGTSHIVVPLSSPARSVPCRCSEENSVCVCVRARARVCAYINIYIIHLPSMLHTPPITTRPYHQPYNKLSDFVRTAKPLNTKSSSFCHPGLSKARPQRNAKKTPPERSTTRSIL
jgi:hypothetical protein